MKFKNNFLFLLLGLVLVLHTLILTKLIYFPYPELFIYPYLTNHDLKPYSQILDQHFPGLMFLPVNLDNLSMNTPEAARLFSIFIVVIIQIMLFFIGSEIFKSKMKALLVNTLFLIWQPFFEGWVLWIDSFLPFLLLPAFYALYRGNQGDRGEGENRWALICGLFLGLGIVFKQTIIPLSVLVFIYLFWTTRNIKTVLMYSIGILVPVSLMLFYIIVIGVWRDFWYWTVIFNMTAFAQSGRGSGPSVAHFWRALLVFGFAFLVVRKIKLKEVQILLLFLIGSLIGLSTRFDFVHFQPALPFALLATVYGLRILRGWRKIVVSTLYGAILIWWLIIFYKGHLGNRVISFDQQTKTIASKVKSLTTPQEKIFVFGAAPHLYQMTNTLPAGDIFIFQFPWFLKVAQGRILEGIKKDQPNIIISDRSIIIEGAKITDFARDLDQYINQNYQKIDSVGTTDILRRNSTI